MKKSNFLQIFFLFLLVSFTVKANSLEQTISLNGVWNFKADYYSVGIDEQWFATNTNDAGWDKMQVPGNWDIRNEYAQYTGKGWYRTSFVTPQDANSKVVRLLFEAVGLDYKVWLNGELVSDITGGYFPNNINIGSKLKAGQKNVLAVCADNTFRSGAYWSWGGIRRPVQLIVNNPIYIETAHILANPDLKKGTADISVRANIQNPSASAKNGVLEYELLFGGKTIRKAKQNFQFTGSNTQQVDFSIALAKKEVKLWHFDFPHLYSLKIKLVADNNPMHETSERFGIRKVEIRDKKFLLNGEEIRAMGLNWVADNRLTGNTLPADMFKREIDNMKKLGVNLSRLSHVPLTKDIYDYLDEKGMMIIAEVPLWGVTTLAEPNNPIPFIWLKKLVNNSFNHPSIVGWCVGNEIGYVKHNPEVMKYVEKSIQFVKDSLDKSRLVVMVSHSAAHQSDDPSKFSDFVPINTYGGWGWELDRVRTFQPTKAVFMTEYGQNLIGEDINTANLDFGKILKQIRNRDYVFGASLWTYNDYRSFHRSSNLTWDTKVSQNRDWGLVDGYGNIKRAFYAIRKEHAPFKTMVVTDKANKLEVKLQPRAKLDLPAFTLRSYRLVCEELTANNQWVKCADITLPDVKPGDSTFVQQIAYKNSAVQARRISVFTPTGYAQMDTAINYRAPEKPIIKFIENNGEKIRVQFDPIITATSYKLVYGETELNISTPETIDNWIETDKLSKESSIGKTFSVKLVAVNAFGETASDIAVQKIVKNWVLPPVVKGFKSFMGGLSIGYASDPNEYLYKVQYSTSPDFTSNTHIIQTPTKGACFVPNLKAGVKYYFRMCTVHQYEVQSDWGMTYSVVI